MTPSATDHRHTNPRPGRRWLRRTGLGLTAALVIVVALVGLLQLPPVATLAVLKLLTLAPLLEYDHVSNGRFRHGARFVRWRPDKAPRQCTMEQIQ